MPPKRSSRRKIVQLSSDNDDHSDTRSEIHSDDASYTGGSMLDRRGSDRSKRNGATKRDTTTSTKSKSKSVSSTKTTPKRSPAKSKKSTTAQDQAASRSITSFFNTAVLNQQEAAKASRPQAKTLPTNVPEDIETIFDDDEDVPAVLEPTALSKASTVAQTAFRKRKLGNTDHVDDAFSSAPNKFRKTVPTSQSQEQRPWTEQFGPVNLSELVVHSRKVANVRSWLESAFTGRRHKILLLKGPAGTGKTTTIKLLARELNLKVVEWNNPLGSDFGADGPSRNTAAFHEFIGRAGRASGLHLASSDGVHISGGSLPNAQSLETPQSDQNQILLVEEFPSTFSNTSTALQSFRTALLQYLSAPAQTSPINTVVVLIVSETLLSTSTSAADSFTAYRLLGSDLNHNPWLDSIEFNRVAPTLLQKALEQIVLKEARKSGRKRTPGPQVIKRLAEAGDIRSAVSSLEFLCLRNDDGDTWSSKIVFKGPKKMSKAVIPLTKAEEEALKLIAIRESTLGIFHSVGKVLYNKRQPPDIQREESTSIPPWLAHSRRERLPETDANDLFNEMGTDSATFLAGLHENYSLSCSQSTSEATLAALSDCIDVVSDADLLTMERFSTANRAFNGSAADNIRQDELAFQVAVRGLLFNLPQEVHRSTSNSGRQQDAHKMFYPASLRIWKKQEEVEGTLSLLTSLSQAGMLLEDRAAGHGPRRVATGVDAWALQQDQSSQKPTDVSHGCITRGSRAEMLLERFPYTAVILTARGTTSSSPRLRQQLDSLTRIRGSDTSANASAEDADEHDDAVDMASTDQWTTDPPEGRIGQPTSNSRSGPGEGRVGGAVGVVEGVESLVLVEDDIEDD